MERYWAELSISRLMHAVLIRLTNTAAPDYLQQAMSNIHAEVLARYYGCGLISNEEITQGETGSCC